VVEYKEINMKNRRHIVTSESVNIGHPDKTCDIIADAFLDAALEQDKYAQMAVECAIKDDLLMIYGEATTTAKIDYKKIARQVLKEIGYTCKFKIIEKISKQSPEINKATVGKDEVTANDQGIVYGYATNETEEFMPMSIMMAHKIMREYEKFRESDSDKAVDVESEYLPDAKCQVSVEYDGNKPVSVHTILLSVSHEKTLTNNMIKDEMTECVIKPVLDEYSKTYNLETKNCKLIINPSGAFTIWGSFSDSGCVGRKIVVDTYGGVGRVGGGCFSSKNATKVDRSGAYYARYVAKNIVAKKMADKCEISVSYAIGLSDPLKVNVETFGTEKASLEKIYEYVEKNFNFSPANIIKELNLLLPIYKKTACFGHFGRDEFPWERLKN